MSCAPQVHLEGSARRIDNKNKLRKTVKDIYGELLIDYYSTTQYEHKEILYNKDILIY